MNYNKNSESLANLKSAFEHESSGYVRYMILNDKAQHDGVYDLARLYKQLAEEEYSHAKNWYKQIHNEDEQNSLQNSIDDETKEYKYWYPRLASKAELEGFESLADMFLATGNVEGDHSRLLSEYKSMKEKGTLYSSPEEVTWRCTVCGHSHIGTMPPNECPLCGYNRSVFIRVGL